VVRHYRQVHAVTKLALKQTLSVPKLELNATLQATDRPGKWEVRRCPWGREGTGSSTTRNWIRNNIANYHETLMSHHVGEAQIFTKPELWRFIPGRVNPADEVTWSTLEEKSARCWDGQDFLRKPMKQLPKITVAEINLFK
jgi:hypothetical protein